MSEEGDRLVDIVLVDPGPRPIPIYDAIRRLTGLNVKQARKLADAPLQAIITQVPLRQAQALQVELEASGATVELRPAGAPGAPTDLLGLVGGWIGCRTSQGCTGQLTLVEIEPYQGVPPELAVTQAPATAHLDDSRPPAQW